MKNKITRFNQTQFFTADLEDAFVRHEVALTLANLPSNNKRVKRLLKVAQLGSNNMTPKEIVDRLDAGLTRWLADVRQYATTEELAFLLAVVPNGYWHSELLGILRTRGVDAEVWRPLASEFIRALGEK